MPLVRDLTTFFSRVSRILFTALCTYLVREASDIRTIADVDRPGVRVIGIVNTTTIRSAAAVLRQTKIALAVSVDAALGMLNCVSKWMEEAKASGSVRCAFDRWGFANADVAPPSP